MAAILHSTVCPEYLRDMLMSRYDLGDVTLCLLLRRGFNDVYQINTSDQRRFIARISGKRRRGQADIQYEAQFILALERAGLCAATPLPTHENKYWSALSLPEGERPLSLFRYIEGSRISFNREDGWLLGRNLGDIHNLDKTQLGAHNIYTLDLHHLLDQPMSWFVDAPVIDEKVKHAFSKVSDTLRERGAKLADQLTTTICHGDYHGDNVLRIANSEKIGIFDFDDCGPGYSSYDLATFLWWLIIRGNGASLDPQFAELWSGFLAGYRHTRGLTSVDLEAIAYFLSVRQIWVSGEYASRINEFGMEWLKPAWLERQVQLIESWSNLSLDKILSPSAGSP